MGTDKSLIVIDGRPLLSWVIDALYLLDLPILLVTNTPERHVAFKLPMVSDQLIGVGALGGLHSALTHLTTESALVVGCDMPRLNTDLLAYLVDLAAKNPEADAIVPRIDGHTHPLHAVYQKRITPLIEAQIDSENLALNALLDHLNVQWVDKPDLRFYNPSLDSFTNLNTPQDVSDLPPQNP